DQIPDDQLLHDQIVLRSVLEAAPTDAPIRQPVDVFRLVDAADEDPTDNILKFANTLVVDQRSLPISNPGQAQFRIDPSSGSAYTVAQDPLTQDQEVVTFDAGSGDLTLGTPTTDTLVFDLHHITIGQVTLSARAVPEQTIDLRLDDLRDQVS